MLLHINNTHLYFLSKNEYAFGKIIQFCFNTQLRVIVSKYVVNIFSKTIRTIVNRLPCNLSLGIFFSFILNKINKQFHRKYIRRKDFSIASKERNTWQSYSNTIWALFSNYMYRCKYLFANINLIWRKKNPKRTRLCALDWQLKPILIICTLGSPLLSKPNIKYQKVWCPGSALICVLKLVVFIVRNFLSILKRE